MKSHRSTQVDYFLVKGGKTKIKLIIDTRSVIVKILVVNIDIINIIIRIVVKIKIGIIRVFRNPTISINDIVVVIMVHYTVIKSKGNLRNIRIAKTTPNIQAADL